MLNLIHQQNLSMSLFNQRVIFLVNVIFRSYFSFIVDIYIENKGEIYMKIAWNEIKYQPKKFILIEVLIVIMMFMVIFLSGLSNGLGRIITAQIENFGEVHYILSKDSQGVIPFSNLTNQNVTEIEALKLEDSFGLVIQRSSLSKEDEDNNQDVTFFAIDQLNLVSSKVETMDYSLEKLGNQEVVLDESYKEKGIAVGDTIQDKTSKENLTVVAFAKNAKYGHSSIAFVTTETYEAMRKKIDPNYTWKPQTIVTNQTINSEDLSSQLVVYNSKELIKKIPGYTATNLTLTMITWVLLVASSAVLGVFFYILTLQKLQQFGVLKAIGMSMKQITMIQLSQISILSIIGVSIGLGCALGLVFVLPSSMPFYMTLQGNVTIALSFIMISILCGILSILKIKQVDPIEVIGGKGE